MSDILASVSVVLGAEISGFRAAMAQARRELSGLVKFSEGLKDIGQSLTTYVSAPLALLGTASLAASAKIESLGKGLQAITLQELGKQGVTGLTAVQQAATLTGERMKELQQIAKQPGLGFEAAVQGDVRLRAVGISAEQSAKSISAFANAVATTGGGKSEFDRITVQLAQLSAKGKVLAQDLRPIIEAAPAVSGALQKLYGTVDSETISASLKAQGQSSTDFIAVLTAELAKLPQVQGGLKAIWENGLDALTLTAAKFGDGIAKAFNLQSVGQQLTDAITGLGDKFAALSPGVQKAIVVLAGVAAATGPVLVAVGALGAALPALTAGFATLGITSVAALGPIALAVAAAAAAGLLIYQNWDRVAPLFSDLRQTVGGIFSSLGATFAPLVQAGRLVVAQLGGASVVGRALGQVLTDFIVLPLRLVAGGLDVVIGGFRGFINLLQGDFAGAAAGGRQLLDGLQLGLLNVHKQQPLGAEDLFSLLSAGAKTASADVDYFGDEVVKAGNKVLTLKELQEQLAAALQLRFTDAQAGRDTTADDANIARIRTLIAEYKQLPGHVSAAAQALAKLRAELAALTTLDTVLAVPADGLKVVERRIDTINAGLKRLLEAGVKPNSVAFQQLARESLTLQRGLDKLQASTQLDYSIRNTVKSDPVTLGDKSPDLVSLLGKEFTSHPLAIPYTLTPLKTADIFSAQEDIKKGFLEAGNASVLFGSSFDYLGARAEILKSALAKLISEGASPASAAVREMGEAYRAAADLANINNAATGALASGLTQLGTGLLEGLGQLAAGNLSLEAFGATILNLVGKLATQLGEAIVAVGIGMLGLKTAFTNPFGAIAAGAALIVVGAALSSIASSAANSGGGSASVSTAVPSTPRTYSPAATSTAPASVTITHIVEMKQRGKDLVAAINIATTQGGRIVKGP